MAFRIQVAGCEVACDTLDELEAAIRFFNQPVDGATDAPAPLPLTEPVFQPQFPWMANRIADAVARGEAPEPFYRTDEATLAGFAALEQMQGAGDSEDDEMAEALEEQHRQDAIAFERARARIVPFGHQAFQNIEALQQIQGSGDGDAP